MTLDEFINQNTGKKKKIGISEERFLRIKEDVKQYIAYWREYPDMFVDFLQEGAEGPWGPHQKKLKFFFYQRVMLRAALRYRYTYVVEPRGYSKSFLAVLSMILIAILYPGSRPFTSAAGKGQSADILRSKFEELIKLVPALDREVDYRPRKTSFTKDKIVIYFKNGSIIDNLAANEKSRGQRRTNGVLEECASMDGDILQEVLIPTMAISRRLADGSVHAEEPTDKAQCYITTAGYKDSFAYRRLIYVLVKMIVAPEQACIIGGTWRIPLIFGQYSSKTWLDDQKRAEDFSEEQFGREYEGKWAGVSEDAFYSPEIFDKCRLIHKAENEYSKAAKNSYYIISADVGRFGCDTVATIVKVTPRVGNTGSGNAAHISHLKQVVNIFIFHDMHFQDQSLKLKTLYYLYSARRLVIDANGVGGGLMDYLVKPQVDPITGNQFPDFGVMNDEKNEYKRYRTDQTEIDAIYQIKAHAAENTEAYVILQSNLNSGLLRFLIDERSAKNELLATKAGQAMSPEARNEYLKPYIYTTILKQEMMNLKQENEGVNIKLNRCSSRIGKDKFSSLIYALYYIKKEEEQKKKNRKFKAADWMFFN